ncbi:indolepyruvate oxidoreductase subunit beta [Desulfoprunum benzoelyticum]|uniref:Indolepyruvate ferredoxin oxidoreductase beta subunit n=1 Tax=Desulfoprunum benzoelyticum TaxID=1506996 RepID=A0A840UWT9_9BACT|nr:indolepyruvate oxidoreductase subunit beta [Desulfoprunum benzoelyticum]MBB5349403.1 indolepyruvate ferredoxin oxidoreductase beta subunit [Desulfoprunum benzoelyticum]MBM9531187.1 indolepyruvate oxidoreductase subunit beta [Desulfoprunum benzoelyticum]
MNTTRVILVAVGGQGNLLASSVLGEAALLSQIPVRMSEIHGMAQRGGVVESAMVFGDAKSPVISDGEADVLVGFEPSETLRALKKCNNQTVVITNLEPLPPFTVAIGKGVYPDLNELQNLIRAKTARLISIDAVRLAREAGNELAVNMVLLGALIQTEKLPVKAETVKEVIRTKTKQAFVESNIKAFELGFSAAQQKNK